MPKVVWIEMRTKCHQVLENGFTSHLSPIRQLLRTSEWRQKISNLIREIVRVCYDVKDTISELHDAKRVFESLVRSPRVHQIK